MVPAAVLLKVDKVGVHPWTRVLTSHEGTWKSDVCVGGENVNFAVFRCREQLVAFRTSLSGLVATFTETAARLANTGAHPFVFVHGCRELPHLLFISLFP